ncbi:MAG: hypothetical protein MUC72_09730 [Acidobacteria bacterium]|jgi:hypothetical protein|nr:hypothetical protein [Acidobacteriota bacterium]
MKKILVLIIIAAAGYFAYQNFIVGKQSEETGQVRALAGDFAAIKQQLAQAERSAGATGMDTTSEANSAMGAAEALLKTLQELQGGLGEEEALQEAEELEAEIRAFLNRE